MREWTSSIRQQLFSSRKWRTKTAVDASGSLCGGPGLSSSSRKDFKTPFAFAGASSSSEKNYERKPSSGSQSSTRTRKRWSKRRKRRRRKESSKDRDRIDRWKNYNVNLYGVVDNVSGCTDREVGKEFYYSKLLSRTKVELTVLGFIAMLIWSVRQCGAFNYKTSTNKPPATMVPEDVDVSSMSIGSDASGTMDDSATTATPAAYLFTATYRSNWMFPANGDDLLHTIEDVHMEMFLAMIFYFGSIFNLVYVTNRDILQNFEDGEFTELLQGTGETVLQCSDEEKKKHELYSKCKDYVLYHTESVYGIHVLSKENVYLEKYFQRVIHEMITQLVEFGFRCWVLVLEGTALFLLLIYFDVSRWWLMGSVFFVLVTLLGYLHFFVGKPGWEKIATFSRSGTTLAGPLRHQPSATLQDNNHSTQPPPANKPLHQPTLLATKPLPASRPLAMLEVAEAQRQRSPSSSLLSFKVEASLNKVDGAHLVRSPILAGCVQAAPVVKVDKEQVFPEQAHPQPQASSTATTSKKEQIANTDVPAIPGGIASPEKKATAGASSPESNANSLPSWKKMSILRSPTAAKIVNAITSPPREMRRAITTHYLQKMKQQSKTRVTLDLERVNHRSSFAMWLKKFHELYSTETITVRLIQALQFFLCYACTRGLCSRRTWSSYDLKEANHLPPPVEA
ncbi:unnamed protein product [Amoebophrya sp. A25]|nr:unnamed protein product [Amoebophrya sp. A25]|eukprot:GSA25T00027399001.1